jgi:hypothetical protein
VRVVQVSEPIYGTRLHVCCTPDPAKYVKYIADYTGAKRVTVPLVSWRACFQRVEVEGLYYDSIWLRRFDGGAQDVGVLTHEVYHYVCDVLSAKGIRRTRSTEEAYAYMLGFVMAQAVRKLTKEVKARALPI